MRFKSILISLMLVLLLGSLFAAPTIFNYMDFNGKVGAAYDFTSDDDSNSGDVVLTNFDLGLTIKPVDFFSAYLGLEYNSHFMDGLEVEEAYAKVRIMEEYPLHITGGQFYMPTSLDSNYSKFITNPLTYQFAEMPEVGLMVDFGWETLTLKAAIFRENLVFEDPEEDYNLEAFVINLATEHQIEEVDFMVGASYISNLKNSVHFLAPMDGDDEIGAFTVGATVNWRNWGFLGEFLMTLDDLGADKVSVMHTELSFALTEDWVFAGKFGMSQDGEEVGLPETLFGGIASYTFMRNSFSSASIAAEYVFEAGYDDEDTHNGLLKLTYKF